MKIDDELIDQVWEKARAVNEMDSAIWREDECGAWINRLHYGKHDAEFGWKIENTSGGSEDAIENLRAFHVGNGFDSGARHARCRVTADRDGQSSSLRALNPRNREV